MDGGMMASMYNVYSRVNPPLLLPPLVSVIGPGPLHHKMRVRDDPRAAMTAAVLSQGDDFGAMGGFGGGVSSNPSSMQVGNGSN